MWILLMILILGFIVGSALILLKTAKTPKLLTEVKPQFDENHD